MVVIDDFDKTKQRLLNEFRMGKSLLSFGYTSDATNTVHGLIDLIEEVGVEGKAVCEVGSFLGVSTETFAIFQPLKIYAIDIWDDNFCEPPFAVEDHPQSEKWLTIETSFREKMNKYPNIEIIKDSSLNAVKNFDDESLDIVYIDGDHSYEAVKKDIIAWCPKVKRGGHVCGHDYYPNCRKVGDDCSVHDAVNEFAAARPIKTFSDTSWSFKKV